MEEEGKETGWELEEKRKKTGWRKWKREERKLDGGNGREKEENWVGNWEEELEKGMGESLGEALKEASPTGKRRL